MNSAHNNNMKNKMTVTNNEITSKSQTYTSQNNPYTKLKTHTIILYWYLGQKGVGRVLNIYIHCAWDVITKQNKRMKK